MALSVEGYRSLKHFHEYKHIERWVDFEAALEDLVMSDRKTAVYIEKFHQAEANLRLAHDMLEHRLSEVIGKMEADGA
jgi:hypothetical protein